MPKKAKGKKSAANEREAEEIRRQQEEGCFFVTRTAIGRRKVGPRTNRRRTPIQGISKAVFFYSN
jgi:hypothetical protein